MRSGSSPVDESEHMDLYDKEPFVMENACEPHMDQLESAARLVQPPKPIIVICGSCATGLRWRYALTGPPGPARAQAHPGSTRRALLVSFFFFLYQN